MIPFQTHAIQIVSRSSDRIVIKQKHRTLWDLIFEIFITAIFISFTTTGLSTVMIFPLLVLNGVFPTFLKEWGFILNLIKSVGFWSLVIAFNIYFFAWLPIQTIWTFDRHADCFNCVQTSLIGWQRISVKHYLPQSLKLYSTEINSYRLQKRPYWDSQSWAVLQWENDNRKINNKKDNRTELQLPPDEGIQHYDWDEIHQCASIAPVSAIQLFNQLYEFFGDRQQLQPLRPDVMIIKSPGSEFSFDSITDQFIFKLPQQDFSQKMLRKPDRIEIPLHDISGINWEIQNSWLGKRHNLFLQRENSNKNILLSDSLGLKGNFIYNRVFSWLTTEKDVS